MPSPNDTIQIALIGAGGMGQGDARQAASLPGVKLVAACDCYDGRLTRMKEVYGADTFTTRDYRELAHFRRLPERRQACVLRKADGACD
jgi:predicted homoserine dehydrogenase-like protein